ncbi:uncharacterized protein LOC109819544 [Asparagus officinalis]|uniref:uncharacterized protein LOC109819544 n=1 Tax=Asparagus officinalis TaxID=4686 RepID=UPI00098E4642|nr:uncharacterized protein LOC109819544 [Asparagus officinalis]
MARKKVKNGKKILEIGLRASNPSSSSPVKSLDAVFLEIGLRASNPSSSSPVKSLDAVFFEDDEESDLDLMGSTGPIGEKKKVLLSDLLSSATDPVPSVVESVENSLSRHHVPQYDRNLDDKSDLKSSSSELNAKGILDDLDSASFLESDLDGVKIANHSPVNKSPMENLVLKSSKSNLVDDSPVNKSPMENLVLKSSKSNLVDDPQLESKTECQNPVKSWASLFTDNRKSGSDMNLSFVSPSSNDTVIFDEEEWNEGNSLWQFSLIGQVLGLNAKFKAMESYIHKVWARWVIPEICIIIKAMESYIHKVWARWVIPEICIIKPGIFLFKFKNKDEMNDILVNGPWFFGSRPLLLKAWSSGDEIEKLNDYIYPMWIQFPALRLNLWNSKSLSKIASLIGKPIATDKLTASRQRLSYARVLVEAHMPAPLPDQISIQGPNGVMIKQKVIYELKPKWCDKCKIVGHDTMYCRRFPKTQRWVPKNAQNGKNHDKQEAPGICVQGNTTPHESGILREQRLVHEPGNFGQVDNQMHIPDTQDDHIGENQGTKQVSISETPEMDTQSHFVGSCSKSPRNPVHVVHIQNLISGNVENRNKGLQDINSWSLVQNSKVRRGLIEIKIKDDKLPVIARKLAHNWRWEANVGDSGKARIMILWDPNLLDIHMINHSAQHITCSVKSLDGRINCVTSTIYGYNQAVARKELWSELKHIQQAIGNIHWLISGDFNAMVDNDEKLGDLLYLRDPSSRVWSRLDRSLVNDSWLHQHNSSQVEYLLPGLSDHSPGLISIFDDFKLGKRPFKFFNMWIKHENFLPVVSSIWQNEVKGYKMFSVWSKLKLLRSSLKDLNRKHFNNIGEQVQRAKLALEEVQNDLQSNLMCSNLINREKECLASYNKLLDCELSYYQQKSRIAWSIKGDRCTDLFHKILECNRHHNRVLALYKNTGERMTDSDEIAKEFVSYYQNLMGRATDTIMPDMNVIKLGPCLSDSQANLLQRAVSKEEIKEAIFSMSDNRAPGPDGYGACFFKSAWSIVGDEITQAVEEFFTSGKLLGTLNSTSITLIPKVHCPKTPSDFRPISCCNSLYKCISKILANRVKSVLGYLVNEAQSAFIKGRQITSNTLLAHELVKSYSRRNISSRIMLNIDIKKAFDTISWNFLHEMLKGLGFPKRIVDWIMVCISTPKYSISLNGTLHGYFKGERGLRQGDPLSPYLFILGMEYLSRSLDLLKQDKQFKYHPRCGKMKITHLIFADDLLLFGKGDLYSVKKLYQCVTDFGNVSGLEANKEKSSIFFGGVEESVKTAIKDQLCLTEGCFPIRYLGVPLVCKRLSYEDCNSLLNKITSQIQTWQKHRKLTYAGRLQVIKSIILGVQIYWTSNYLLPVKVTQKIDEICRNYLWGSSNLTSKIPLVSWDRVCMGKKQGGLGIFSASIWNLAAALKNLWNIHVNRELMWIKWIHGTYLKQRDIWHVKARSGDSWMWKQLIKARDKALNFCGGVGNLIQLIGSCYKGGKLKLSALYHALNPASSNVQWHNTIWESLCYPKHSFISWLAVNNRLNTQDRLLRRGIINTNHCTLCTASFQESRSHLFFECAYSSDVWNCIMDWLQFSWRSCHWEILINWFSSRLKGRGIKQRVKRMALSATIYAIWTERNMRVFQGKNRSVEHLVNGIKVDIMTVLLNSNISSENVAWIHSL